MAPAAGSRVFEFVPEGATWLAEFLRRLASATAAAPPGTGVLLERRAGRAVPLVVPSSVEGSALVVDAARGLPGGLRSRGRLPPTLGRPGAPVAFGELRASDGPPPAPEPTEARGRSAVPPERPGDRGFDRIDGATVQFHWFPAGAQRLGLSIRFRVTGPWRRLEHQWLSVAVPLAECTGLSPVPLRGGWWTRRLWETGALSRAAIARLPTVPFAVAAAAVPGPPDRPFPSVRDLGLHTVVVGATGSGKTSWLAMIAARQIQIGGSVVIVDVHGDLAPATIARLVAGTPRPLAAIDSDSPGSTFPGVQVLVPDEASDAEAAALVAGLKRLSADGSDLYWGFRLERLFDTFVRLTLEEGGDLGDLAELLTDPRRRDAARLSTRRPEIARFLDDLPALERRNPEFLWPAAARVSKVLLSDRLRRLLAPPVGGLQVGPWLARGGSILIRLPFRSLGPEATSFAATLLATRAYLSVTRLSPERSRRFLFVLDESQAFSPRLLTEILSEGRKFGVGLLMASQYPDRWPPELRAAAAGSAGHHVAFRVPPIAAGATGAWIGLPEETARRWLPQLPWGRGLASGETEEPRWVTVDRAWDHDERAWQAAVALTAAETGAARDEVTELWTDDERSLFAIWSAEVAAGAAPMLESASLLDAAVTVPPERIAQMARRGWVERSDRGLTLTVAGHRRLGLGGPSGAPSESEEHRALLLETARIFLRRGCRLEVIRQGRFDTRLPDARVLIGEGSTPDGSPAEQLAFLQARQHGWAWRYFGGRDVSIEAEVSGALRAERIRRGLSKAQRAGTFALFVVADPLRARRVRAVLLRQGAFPHRAAVWTLPRAARRPMEGGVHR